jgi:hypothetical protein
VRSFIKICPVGDARCMRRIYTYRPTVTSLLLFLFSDAHAQVNPRNQVNEKGLAAVWKLSEFSWRFISPKLIFKKTYVSI